ncbi:MAG TPA: arsenate reductase (glutaredoxin) [Maribacter sp.]|nr:arsenate reductase (glutaredoxin) [Candidatus Neomarinimicrobiota bacterium]HAF78195.1 arsenate reductase (glutaredoxin) [Maribacter sp.]
MKKITIYHNPRCSKSRQTLQLLRDNNVEPKIIEYLKTPLKKDELKNITNMLGLRPKEFIRKNENDFKENNLSEIIDDNDKIIEAMVSYPKIIERPIVAVGEVAVIGRPPENVLEILK